MSAGTQKIDIHNKKGNYERQLTNFRKRKDILAENKQQITGYLEYCLSNGRSADRAIKYLTHLTMMACFFKKPFKKVEEGDIRKFLAHSESRNLSPETVRDYKTALKVFFRWLYNTKEDPELVSWFNTTLKNGKHRLPEEMLVEDEIIKLIEAASHPRDKAFIAALWESGARVGEIGSLKIKHLAFDAIGARILVDGKTGQRRQRLITSVPYLSQWKNL